MQIRGEFNLISPNSLRIGLQCEFAATLPLNSQYCKFGRNFVRRICRRRQNDHAWGAW